MRRVMGLLIAGALLVCGGRIARAADDAKEPTKEGVEFFEKNIRPVLADKCYKCHSVEAKANKKLKSKLYLDSWQGMAKGGESDKPAVVAGKPDDSMMIKGLRYEYKGDDEDLNMPPAKDGKSNKLPDDVIKNFEKWVKDGAQHPKDFDKPPAPKAEGNPAPGEAKTATAQAAEKPHWAFVAPKEPALPAVKDASWAKNPIDTFIQAKLEAKGLTPSPSADRRTLIRRATFDLTGLPPTPAEVEAFVNDKDPNAWEKVVDRLLDSPRYGERWARHWLDVARYSDTKGYVFQEERRYPFAYTYRDWVINAFNSDLPYDQFLVQQIAADQLDLGADKRPLAAMGFLTLGRRFLNAQPDIIDDRIDVVCRGTMALTVTCARCHDHKFDPIPTKDYYSLYGVFASSVEPKDLPPIGNPDATPTPASLAFEKELKTRQAAAEDFLKNKTAEVLKQVRSAKGLADYLTATAKADSNEAQPSGGSDLSRYLLRRWRDYLGTRAAAKDPVFAALRAYAAIPADQFEKKAAEVTEQLGEKKPEEVHPLVAKAFVEQPPKSLRDVADRYGELLAKYDKPEPLSDAQEESLRSVLRGPDSPVNVPEEQRQGLLRRDAREQYMGLKRKVDEFVAGNPQGPPRAMVLQDAPDPHDTPVLVRGNANNPGPVVPRQFLQVLSGPQRQHFTHGSGRLELARAIASRDNPLTARVIVNRVWLWHFGQGIVRTPSDFGTRSDPPSHPELLDWLALRFVEDPSAGGPGMGCGWSVKRLHKLILMSATYQQSSDDNPEARKGDPENTLLWRFNPQRLDWEETRDALVFVGGGMDEKVGGRPVDITDAKCARRTIYGFIDRQNLPGLFRAFDMASPDTTSPQRFNTTVPQQALFFMNSPFTRRQAKLVADRPEVESVSDPAERIRVLYQLLYQRDPSDDEVSAGVQFVARSLEREQHGAISPWEEYVQVLLEANEFVFVD
jgi:Protein of unknown function (DUF1549)/Protein of unknown function (DUF1553)/Planctomycete cytochrome C